MNAEVDKNYLDEIDGSINYIYTILLDEFLSNLRHYYHSLEAEYGEDNVLACKLYEAVGCIVDAQGELECASDYIRECVEEL